MKMFLISFCCLIAASLLFVFGAMGQNGFLMLTMCPSAIVALWLNGFAFATGSKAFAKGLAKLAGLQVVEASPQSKPSKSQSQARQEYQ